MAKITTLEDCLNARRMMDHAALALTDQFFNLAKTEYLNKLKLYSNETTDKNAFKLFVDSEKGRIEQLTLFNRTGSNDVDHGNYEALRAGSPVNGDENTSL